MLLLCIYICIYIYEILVYGWDIKMFYSVIFLNNKFCIYLMVWKSMIIRIVFCFYVLKLSYIIFRILKFVLIWGWIINYLGLMKSEWEFDVDVLLRVGCVKWGVNLYVINN